MFGKKKRTTPATTWPPRTDTGGSAARGPVDAALVPPGRVPAQEAPSAKPDSTEEFLFGGSGSSDTKASAAFGSSRFDDKFDAPKADEKASEAKPDTEATDADKAAEKAAETVNEDAEKAADTADKATETTPADNTAPARKSVASVFGSRPASETVSEDTEKATDTDEVTSEDTDKADDDSDDGLSEVFDAPATDAEKADDAASDEAAPSHGDDEKHLGGFPAAMPVDPADPVDTAMDDLAEDLAPATPAEPMPPTLLFIQDYPEKVSRTLELYTKNKPVYLIDMTADKSGGKYVPHDAMRSFVGSSKLGSEVNADDEYDILDILGLISSATPGERPFLVLTGADNLISTVYRTFDAESVAVTMLAEKVNQTVAAAYDAGVTVVVVTDEVTEDLADFMNRIEQAKDPIPTPAKADEKADEKTDEVSTEDAEKDATEDTAEDAEKDAASEDTEKVDTDTSMEDDFGNPGPQPFGRW